MAQLKQTAAGPSCPEPEKLVQMLLGKLSEDQVAALASHVETCPTCQLSLDEFTLEEGLLPDADLETDP
jgi:hypothetical protein